MSAHDEIEIKLAAGGECFRQLLALLKERHGYQPGEQRTIEQEDHYYDTDDWWFFRAGLALRGRRIGSEVYLSLKSLTPLTDGIAQRREIEEKLRRRSIGILDAVPMGKIRTMIEQCGGPVRVRPLFRLDTKRELVTCNADSEEIAVSLDQVTVFRVEKDVHSLVSSFEEIEIEWRAGGGEKTREVLASITERLAAPGSAVSKFERGLGAVGLKPPAPAVRTLARPDDRLADTAYRVLAFHLDQVCCNEPGARLGLDEEYLHQMRVATRRLRTALRAFKQALPAPRMNSFARDLRWLGGALGAVRDLDVYIGNLPEYAGHIPPEEVGVLGYFEDELKSRRLDARDRLLHVLNSERYARFIKRFRVFLGRGPARKPAAVLGGVRSAEAAGVILGRAYDRVVRRGEKAVRDASPGRLHRVRIACKRLRYACEWLGGLYDDRAAAFTEKVIKVQELLGRHHDAVVAADRLSASAEEIAGRNGEHSSLLLLALGQMIARQRQIIREAERDFPEHWKEFSKKKVARKLLWEPVQEAYDQSMAKRRETGSSPGGGKPEGS